MGLLDSMLGGQPAVGGSQRPSLGNTVAAGVVLALLVKAIRSHQAAEQRTFDPNQQGAAPQPGGLGGLSGMLGGLTGGGGGGLGGLLGGLGGAGALGGLLGQLQNSGLGQQASSWIGMGQNQSVAPHQLADALGPDAVNELQQQTGLPRDQLLQQLAHELPDAVNQATPNGQLPNDQELHQIVGH